MFKLQCSCGETHFILEKPINSMSVHIVCTGCGETLTTFCEYNLEKPKENL